MLNQNISAVLHGLGKTIIPAIALLMSSIIKLILNTILVKINPDIFILGGTAGAALATVVSHVFSFLISMYILKKNIKINFGIRSIIKPMILDFEMEVFKFMEKEKVKYLIDMINDMDVKNKLRLAICMSKSEWSGLIYNTKENYERFDNMLKTIDEEYRTTLINFGKYKLVMFAMAKLMEMETTEQNKVALYLFNSIKNNGKND